MANVTCFKLTQSFTIPPDGTEFFTIGPNEAFANGAITVTAIPRTGTPGVSLFMEVVQMATRTAPKFGANPSHSLDIVVRNNSHANNPADSLSTITSFDVFVSVVTP
jgi:hypothetical protein